jgi:hypothetical protein
MDMDDDFVGEVEFDLSAAQGEIVNRAINLASSLQEDGFAHLNPLIAIMQWWQTNVPEAERTGVTPEARLVEACRRFLGSHAG